jgi:hypothetical protein
MPGESRAFGFQPTTPEPATDRPRLGLIIPP